MTDSVISYYLLFISRGGVYVPRANLSLLDNFNARNLLKNVAVI
ncbi:hypothetical protein RintRC_4534 [Richelia intracellularis]|nr:hypothetical protein RintRC_4534 [Richelia intracellularis]